MSTSFTADPAVGAGSSKPVAPERRAARWSGWLREPLLHFMVLGGLLFAVDYALLEKEDDSRTIVVGAAMDREAIVRFEASRGRKPTADELAALRQVWLDNEVLYREGLALGLDKGDPAIRERVILKAWTAIDRTIRLPAADEAALRAWFEAHRDRYDEPARFDFEEAALSGSQTEAAVRELAQALNDGAPGDPKVKRRVFKARPRANLVESYGRGFTEALEATPLGVWHALETRDGWRAMKLDAMLKAKPATFDAAREMVLRDWKDAAAEEARKAAVRALAEKYTVQYEGSAE